MNILHLSDIHFSINDNNFKKYVLEPLLNDLKEQIKLFDFELIIFTGDLIDKGGSPHGVLETLERFENEVIMPILSILKLPTNRFIFVPGNHDIDRSKAPLFTEKGLKDALINAEAIENALRNPKDLNLERIEDFRFFEEYFFGDSIEYKKNNFGYSIVTEISNKKIGIACINNSWRCYDDKDQGNLIVGKTQLNDVDEHLSGHELDLKIALMHHPLEYLIECEIDLVKDYIYRDYDLLFTGHTHQSHAQSITTNVGNGCIICSASSNWEKNSNNKLGLNRNGYNILTYNDLENEVTIFFRQYNYQKHCFVPNTDLGFKETGESKFRVGDIHSRELFTSYSDSIKFIKDHFIETIDKNLVSYNTDTAAPKRLKDLFVLPKIKIRDYSEIDKFEDFEKNIETLDLVTLSNYQKDLLIVGQHESGKTTLLFRLMLEFIENSYINRIVPIYIDFKSINNMSIEKKISSFMATSNKKTEDILNNFNVILLLDNFRFLIENGDIYDQLKKLKEKYPNINFIATYNHHTSNEIPKEFSEHEISQNVDVATLEYFKSDEIQNLMEKWFISSDEIKDSQISQVVKNFHSLNIPSTPLAVSLFLWIYEKQKGFVPRNNAAMVQNFLEKLFEKHSNTDFLSSKFDFHNKDNLLGHIAMEMYNQNLENYSIEELDLKKFISELNSRKKVGLETHNGSLFSEWVLEYFLDKGIFLSEIKNSRRYYKFKLNCFFQYYLAKAMTFSADFKQLVLSEHHYLTFQNEIDYYSGLHRHDREILSLLLMRMESNFIELFKDQWTEKFKLILENVNSNPPFDKLFAKGNSLSNNKSETSLVIEDLDEKDRVVFLDKHKKTTEVKKAENDLMLSTTNNLSDEEKIINKIPQSQLSPSEIIRDSWILVSRVLKNVEDLEDGDLKDRAYRSTLICSLMFLYFTVLSAEEHADEAKKNNDERLEFYNFFTRFAVLLHQNLLFSVMGTSKLTPVIFDYLNNNQIKKSDVETFISCFLIIDSGEENFEKFKESFNKALKYNLSGSVKDFVLIKLQMLDAQTTSSNIEEYYRTKINYLIKDKLSGSPVVSKQDKINENTTKNNKAELISALKQN